MNVEKDVEKFWFRGGCGCGCLWVSIGEMYISIIKLMITRVSLYLENQGFIYTFSSCPHLN